MRTPQSALSNTLVGLVGLLTVGAILFSLWTAPPDAVYRLHLAADATASASGFVLTDTNSVTPSLAGLPTAAQQQLGFHDVVRIVYRAPDRVEDHTTASGHPVTQVVVGAAHYERLAGRWYRLPSRRSLGTSDADVVLLPLESAEGANDVVPRAGGYLFLPADVDRFTMKFLRSHVAQLTSVSVFAVVRGDYLTGEHISAVRGDNRLTVDFTFTSIGSAPPVQVPPPSEVVHLPVSGRVR